MRLNVRMIATIRSIEVDALHLRKGDMVSMDVTAAASDGENGYSYVRLNSVPLVVSGEGMGY